MMIDSIEISGIRGIAQGQIKGLTAINVLVGKNGCGKSTVLDCLELMSCQNVGTGIVNILERRGREDSTIEPDWMCRNRMGGRIAIDPKGALSEAMLSSMTDGRLVVDFSGTRMIVGGNHQSGFRAEINYTRTDGWLVRFIDCRAGINPRAPMTELFSECRFRGGKAQLLATLKELVPEVEDIELLDLKRKSVVVLSTPSGSVPLSLAGDGIRNSMLLLFELGVPKDSLVLIEEPETALHPGAMALVAKAIALCAQNGPQVVLATHSLEFIDELILATEGEQLLSVHGLSLDAKGMMKVSSLGPDRVRHARTTIGLDMR
jgi:energy-coupling factor transporter ATP-binding protein EcfA2